MELNPCCYESQACVVPGSEEDNYYVKCDKCGCSLYDVYIEQEMYVGTFKTIEDATKAWNKLFPLPPDRSKIEYGIHDIISEYDYEVDPRDLPMQITDYIIKLFNERK